MLPKENTNRQKEGNFLYLGEQKTLDPIKRAELQLQMQLQYYSEPSKWYLTLFNRPRKGYFYRPDSISSDKA